MGAGDPGTTDLLRGYRIRALHDAEVPACAADRDGELGEAEGEIRRSKTQGEMGVHPGQSAHQRATASGSDRSRILSVAGAGLSYAFRRESGGTLLDPKMRGCTVVLDPSRADLGGQEGSAALRSLDVAPPGGRFWALQELEDDDFSGKEIEQENRSPYLVTLGDAPIHAQNNSRKKQLKKNRVRMDVIASCLRHKCSQIPGKLVSPKFR